MGLRLSDSVNIEHQDDVIMIDVQSGTPVDASGQHNHSYIFVYNFSMETNFTLTFS